MNATQWAFFLWNFFFLNNRNDFKPPYSRKLRLHLWDFGGLMFAVKSSAQCCITNRRRRKTETIESARSQTREKEKKESKDRGNFGRVQIASRGHGAFLKIQSVSPLGWRSWLAATAWIQYIHWGDSGPAVLGLIIVVLIVWFKFWHTFSPLEHCYSVFVLQSFSWPSTFTNTLR